MPPDDPPYADVVREAAHAAVARYDLPGPVSVQPIRLLNNAVFAVTAGGNRFALRIHRPRFRPREHSLAELVFLDSVHEHLDDVGVRVPSPVTAESARCEHRAPADRRAAFG
ncbi:hypothetical protein GCM10028833_31710 [Glycomyces tarimensis]